MGSVTGISWTDSTWSPIRAQRYNMAREIEIGWHCEHVSEGCRFCYAETLNKRLGTGLDFKPDAISTGKVEVFLDEKMLLVPQRWRKPRKIFVCSMTDLFAKFVTDEMIDKVFALMALCQQHEFQLLTKRPSRALAYLSNPGAPFRVEVQVRRMKICKNYPNWPLPNVTMGVSVEDQPNANARIPVLLTTPAAKRFVSYEPALAAVDFRKLEIGNGVSVDALTGFHSCSMLNSEDDLQAISKLPILPVPTACLNQIIVGGESGPHARPFDIEWARSALDQSKLSSTSVFIKQMGSKAVSGGKPLVFKDRKGADMAEWPDDLRVQEAA